MHTKLQISAVDAEIQFADWLRNQGVEIKGRPIMDGKWHPAPLSGQKGNKTGASYRGFLDGTINGQARNWKTGATTNWWPKGDPVPMTTAEIRKEQERLAAMKQVRERERIEAEEAAAVKAAWIWANAKPADPAHPYLARKGVRAHGIKQRGDRLVVPLRDVASARLMNIQSILPDGTKLFLKGGRKTGTAFIMGDPQPGLPIFIAEGFSSAATVREALMATTVMALDTSNLLAVVHAVHAKHPDSPIVLAADNDAGLRLKTPPLPNVGLVKAFEAAAEVGGRVIYPEANGTSIDWNDFAAKHGLAATRAALQAMSPRV